VAKNLPIGFIPVKSRQDIAAVIKMPGNAINIDIIPIVVMLSIRLGSPGLDVKSTKIEVSIADRKAITNGPAIRLENSFNLLISSLEEKYLGRYSKRVPARALHGCRPHLTVASINP
jgi:hypothetical protein